MQTSPFQFPFRTPNLEPEKVAAMMRETTVATLDSMLAMQEESRKGAAAGLHRMHEELGRWNQLAEQATSEAVGLCFDLMRAGLQKGRDGVERTGQAPHA